MFINMVFMDHVKVAVMEIVGVTVMLDAHMLTTSGMCMSVIGMNLAIMRCGRTATCREEDCRRCGDQSVFHGSSF